MGSKKHLAKIMKSSLSSKKRKLDEAEIESTDEPEYPATGSLKDKDNKALRAIIAEKNAKLAEQEVKINDLKKQLDRVMNTVALHEKMIEADIRMAKMSDEIAELKDAQARASPAFEGNEIVTATRIHELEDNIRDLMDGVEACEDTLHLHFDSIAVLIRKVDKLEKLDMLMGKTIKDIIEDGPN
ncbi:hypothetical protein V8F20_006146 [Naviculisporaceae sp. PSN 640]